MKSENKLSINIDTVNTNPYILDNKMILFDTQREQGLNKDESGSVRITSLPTFPSKTIPFTAPDRYPKEKGCIKTENPSEEGGGTSVKTT